MTRSRTPARIVVAAAALGLALASLPACASPKPPEDVPAIAPGESPDEFREMRSTLVRLVRLRDAGDAAGARALHPAVLAGARGLLKMGPPSDLTRQRIPRFLEGRGSFGDAVNAYDRAVRGGDDAALWRAVEDLRGTFHGWMDAYRGRPSEGAV